jgi:outer membrane lipoprotein-sorting protein
MGEDLRKRQEKVAARMFLRNLIILIVSLFVAFCLPLSAQTVDEIVSKYTQAHGGLEKLKSISSMKLSGKILGEAGAEVAVTVQKKRPNFLRVDSIYRGKNAVQGYDGKTGWETPLLGLDTLEVTEDQLKEIREDADFDGPLIDYREKGNTIELMGKENVNGAPAYKLKVALNNGDIQYFSLDTGNGLEVKEAKKVKRQDKEVEIEIFFSNYKQVNGLTLPFSIKTKTKGEPEKQITIENVETNLVLDDSIFKMPTSGHSPPSGKSR